MPYMKRHYSGWYSWWDGPWLTKEEVAEKWPNMKDRFGQEPVKDDGFQTITFKDIPWVVVKGKKQV